MADRDELIEQAARELAAWNNLHPYAVRFKMYNVVDDYPDRDPYVVIVEKVAELLDWAPLPQKPVGYVVDGKVYRPDDVQVVTFDRTPAAQVSAADLLERGRQLASQRDDLIAAGVEAAELAVPLAPTPCPTCTGPIRETVGMVCQTCGTDYGGGDRAIAHAKAEALRAFADSIRTTEILFRRSDGSGVKVTDLLRETAQSYHGEADSDGRV